MINVNIIFIFLAAVVFLGFILNALFDRIRVTSVLPLMVIGLLIGPILKLVSVGPASVMAQLTPYITALTISFVLFDVGMSINFYNLKTVMMRATGFMTIVVITTALAAAEIALLLMHWNIIEALVFGFAVSGPSSIIVPTIIKVLKMPEKLSTTLLYESVTSDLFELIVPIILLGFLVTGVVSVQSAVSLFVTNLLSSLALGIILALIWIYVLGRFKEYSKDYSWMLTIAMVVATYGIAQELNISGAIAIFVFGIVLANIGIKGIQVSDVKSGEDKNVSIFKDISHIKEYQREITFFTSTFFFVYIGMLFSMSGLSVAIIAAGVVISIIAILARFLFAPLLKQYMSANDGNRMKQESWLIAANVPRGLSPAIIATLPLTMGIVIPGFLDTMFMTILFTNVVSTVAIFAIYRMIDRDAPMVEKKGSA